MRTRFAALAAILASVLSVFAAVPVSADPAPIYRCATFPFTAGMTADMCIGYKDEYQTGRHYYWGGATIRSTNGTSYPVTVRPDFVTYPTIVTGTPCTATVTIDQNLYCPAPQLVNPVGSPKYVKAWIDIPAIGYHDYLNSPSLS